MPRAARTGSKDVLNEFLLDGVKGVDKLDTERGPLTRKSLRDAMGELQERGKDFSTLEAWCRQKYGFGLHNRHSSRSPRTGDEKAYRVQGTVLAPFMKLPLATLGVKPGSLVNIAFLDGKLVTTAS